MLHWAHWREAVQAEKRSSQWGSVILSSLMVFEILHSPGHPSTLPTGISVLLLVPPCLSELCPVDCLVLFPGDLFPPVFTPGVFSGPQGLCSLPWFYVHLSPGTLSSLCWLSFSVVQLWLLLTIFVLEVFLVISSKSSFIAYSACALVPSYVCPMACTTWFVPQVFRYSLKCHFCPMLHNRLTTSVCFRSCTLFCSWWWGTCPSCILRFRSLPARNWQQSLALILCYADQRNVN